MVINLFLSFKPAGTIHVCICRTRQWEKVVFLAADGVYNAIFHQDVVYIRTVHATKIWILLMVKSKNVIFKRVFDGSTGVNYSPRERYVTDIIGVNIDFHLKTSLFYLAPRNKII